MSALGITSLMDGVPVQECLLSSLSCIGAAEKKQSQFCFYLETDNEIRRIQSAD